MKFLILANFGLGLWKFRKELIQELVFSGNEVTVSLPYDEYIPRIQEIGCKYIETKVDRRGKNPLTDLRLFLNYLTIT